LLTNSPVHPTDKYTLKFFALMNYRTFSNLIRI
jgi:hypothetical protein